MGTSSISVPILLDANSAQPVLITSAVSLFSGSQPFVGGQWVLQNGFKGQESFKGYKDEKCAQNIATTVVSEYLLEDLRFKSITGPFPSPPSSGLYLNRFGAIPKSTPGKFRLSSKKCTLLCPSGQTVSVVQSKVKNIPSGSGRDAMPSPNEFKHLDWLKPLIVHKESPSNFNLTDEVEEKSDGGQDQEEGISFDSFPSSSDNVLDKIAAELDQESRSESRNCDIYTGESVESYLQFSSGNIEDDNNGSQGQDPSTHKEITLGNREINKG
eukprot:gene3921-15246_t